MIVHTLPAQPTGATVGGTWSIATGLNETNCNVAIISGNDVLISDSSIVPCKVVVKYTVGEGECESSSYFTINVVNTNPEIYAPNYLNYCVGQTVNTQVTSISSNVVYTVIGLPAGLTINNLTGVISGTLTALAGTYSVTVSGVSEDYCDADEITFNIVITDCGTDRHAEVDVYFGTPTAPLEVTWGTISTLGTGAFVGLPQSAIKVNGVHGTYNSFNSNKLHDSIYLIAGNLYYDNILTYTSSLYQNVLPYNITDGSAYVVPNNITACAEYDRTPYLLANGNGNTANDGYYIFDCSTFNKYKTIGLEVLLNHITNLFIHWFDPGLPGGGSLYGVGTVINSVTILQNNKYGGVAQVVPVNVTKTVGQTDVTFALNIQNALNAALLSTNFTKIINGVETTLDCNISSPNSFNFNGELHQNAPQIIDIDYVNTHWIYNPNNDGSIKASLGTLYSDFTNNPNAIWTHTKFSKPILFFGLTATYLAYSECDPLSNNDNVVLQAAKGIRIFINSNNNNLTYELTSNPIATYPKNTICDCDNVLGNDLYTCLESGNSGFAACACTP